MTDNSKSCADCRYFDLEEGQAQMFGSANHGAFVQAAGLLSPSEMGRQVTKDANGDTIYDDTGMPVLADNSVAAKTKWSDAGMCELHVEGRFKQDSCDQHQVALKVVQDNVPAPTPAPTVPAEESVADLLMRRGKRWLREQLKE